jgi:hypothetical protein
VFNGEIYAHDNKDDAGLLLKGKREKEKEKVPERS